jgi:ribosomal-protein-alanine N-acetyltransferase
LAETERYIGQVLQQYREGCDGPRAIERRATGRVIGSIHLMLVQPAHRKAEIGFVLSKLHWGQGLAPEALASVLAYSLGPLGLNRVEGFCLVENRAGLRVMEKAGMPRAWRLARSFGPLTGMARAA